MTVTSKTYNSMEDAFNHFNKTIFNSELPQCLFTMVNHRGAYGYFRREGFADRKKGKEIVHEIALNPFTFKDRTDQEILSTLVHEMVHMWQHVFGTPKKTHHDKEWANKMEEIGLMPSSTGAPGGKRTGRRVSHYILSGGLFEKSEKKCKAKIEYVGNLVAAPKGKNKRTKYTCPECETNVYGKKELLIVCKPCKKTMEEN